MSMFPFGLTFAELLLAAQTAKVEHKCLQQYPLHFESKAVAMRQKTLN